jgi:hypothetical protein
VALKFRAHAIAAVDSDATAAVEANLGMLAGLVNSIDLKASRA